MKAIYLVRHCDYSNPRNILVGRLPVELSPTGLKHAERLANYFSDKKIETIYSSAVKRCQQTSEIISNKTIPIRNDQRLLETFSAYQGYWGGFNKTTQELDWTKFFDHREVLGGESAHDIQARVVSFFTEILTQPAETILICSHGDPLYLLYLHLIGKKDVSDVAIYGELPDYQPKGSIRKISCKKNNTFEISPIVEL